MRRISFVLFFVALNLPLVAQPAAGKAKSPAKSAMTSSPEAAVPGTIKDLPVRKVVLYKNGVGYFEHAGTVSGKSTRRHRLYFIATE